MSGSAAPWSFARMARMTFDALDLPDVSDLSVAILGGTGDQGRGLAYRFARAGHAALIGSRTPQRGRAAADDIGTLLGDRAGAGEVTGGDNAWAAAAADVVIIAGPWAGHADTVAALAGPLAGKLVVDCVNPLGFDAQGPYPLSVPEGSAAQQAAALLPD